MIIFWICLFNWYFFFFSWICWFFSLFNFKMFFVNCESCVIFLIIWYKNIWCFLLERFGDCNNCIYFWIVVNGVLNLWDILDIKLFFNVLILLSFWIIILKFLYSCCIFVIFWCLFIWIEKFFVVIRFIFVFSVLIGCRICCLIKIDIFVFMIILNFVKMNNGYSVGFLVDLVGEIECWDNKKIKLRKYSSVIKIEMKMILVK